MPRGRREKEPKVPREFLPAEELSTSKKLEAVKQQLYEQRKKLTDAEVLLERASTDLTAAQLDAARYRVERAMAMEKDVRTQVRLSKDPHALMDDLVAKSEASSTAVQEFLDAGSAHAEAVDLRGEAYDRLHSAHSRCTALVNSELKLWVESHRRIGIELDQMQEVHTKITMYVAAVVHERKLWQAEHAEDALGSTKGFMVRCNELLKMGRPMRFRFGDTCGQLSGKYMSTLVEAGKTVHIGAREEIALLTALVDTLTTGRMADGTAVNVGIIEEKHKKDMVAQNREWGARYKTVLQRLVGMRGELQAMKEVLKDFVVNMGVLGSQMVQGVAEHAEQLIVDTKRSFHTAAAMFEGADNTRNVRRSLVGLRSFAETLLEETASRKSSTVTPNPPPKNSSARGFRRASGAMGSFSRTGSGAAFGSSAPRMSMDGTLPRRPSGRRRTSVLRQGSLGSPAKPPSPRAPHRTATFTSSPDDRSDRSGTQLTAFFENAGIPSLNSVPVTNDRIATPRAAGRPTSVLALDTGSPTLSAPQFGGESRGVSVSPLSGMTEGDKAAGVTATSLTTPAVPENPKATPAAHVPAEGEADISLFATPEDHRSLLAQLRATHTVTLARAEHQEQRLNDLAHYQETLQAAFEAAGQDRLELLQDRQGASSGTPPQGWLSEAADTPLPLAPPLLPEV